MKRLLLLLTAALWLCSCRQTKEGLLPTQYSLSRDFAYAEQVNFIRHKEAAFSHQFQRIEQKNQDSIVQTQPGTLSFTVRLYEHPVLTYSILFQKRTKSDLELRLILESDSPDKKIRHLLPKLDKTNIVDLSEFADRPVRITFSARSRNLPGLGGVITWINPVVEHVIPPAVMDANRVQSFRNTQAKSNVLIFLFDATNASHVSAYGYSRPTTPVIDSIAAGGVLWKNAFSQAVSTLASTGTLFTGVLPDVHRVLKKPSALQERFKTMAECFRELGFETALFTANPNASPVAGYGQGFRTTWNLRKGSAVSADEVVPYVNKWLDQVKDRQFFGYIHFREPHEPYTPPRSVLARFTSDPDFHLPPFEAFVPPDKEGIQKVITAYDANLASGDEQFGYVVRHLKETGLFEKTILVIIADHGEAFWAHGKQGHNSQVYDDMIHIPMIMHFPGSEVRGLKPEQLVGTVDLFPMFADLFQFSRKGIHLNGESLLPFLVGGKKEPDRMIFSETSGQDTYGLRSREFKYIHYRNEPNGDEFYHLSSDPSEKSNVMAEYPALSAYYRMILLKMMEHNKQLAGELNPGPERKAVIDNETEEELRALGYVN